MSHRAALLAASVLLTACSSSGPTAQPTTSSSAVENRGPETTATSPAPTSSERPSAATSAPYRGVHIDDDVFNWADENMTVSNESIIVSGSVAPLALIDALDRAAVRFMHVDETGVEHGSEVELTPPIGSDGEELYTPNYVSTPTETPQGVYLYVDCKGVIDPRMRSRFLQILNEELGILDGEVRVAVAE